MIHHCETPYHLSALTLFRLPVFHTRASQGPSHRSGSWGKRCKLLLQIQHSLLFAARLEPSEQLRVGVGGRKLELFDAVLFHPALGQHITGAVPATFVALVIAVLVHD